MCIRVVGARKTMGSDAPIKLQPPRNSIFLLATHQNFLDYETNWIGRLVMWMCVGMKTGEIVVIIKNSVPLLHAVWIYFQTTSSEFVELDTGNTMLLRLALYASSCSLVAGDQKKIAGTKLICRKCLPRLGLALRDGAIVGTRSGWNVMP